MKETYVLELPEGKVTVYLEITDTGVFLDVTAPLMTTASDSFKLLVDYMRPIYKKCNQAKLPIHSRNRLGEVRSFKSIG